MNIKLHTLVMAMALFCFPRISLAQAPTLGTTASFVLFSTDGAVTNSGVSYLTGNVGTNNGSNTGFGNVNGVMNSANLATSQASADLLIAYNQLNSISPDFFPSNLLGNGDTLIAGVYSIGAAAMLNGVLYLDAGGNTGAVFIIKIQGAFSSTANAKVRLLNGAKACNVFWKTEGLVSLAAGTMMKGTIIANNAAINMNSGDTLEGRALSTTGAVILNGTFAYTPIGCGSPTLTGPVAPDLLSTSGYALFTGSGQVSNLGITHVSGGDIGTNSGSVNGFDSLLVTGVIHALPDSSTARRDSDLVKVYDYINLLTHDIELLYPAQFGNKLVLTPHTYLLNAATLLTDTLYLNAQGNSAAVFVIRINGTLTTGIKSRVMLINGTQAQNVYWRVDGATILNDSSVFHGNILVTNGTLNSGSYLFGRMLASMGALHTNNANINSPGLPAVLPNLIVSTTTGVQGTYNNVTVTSSGNGTLTGNLVVMGNMIVQTGGRLNTADNLVVGNNAFTLSTGATLSINSASGISATGSIGSIQVAGLRSYSAGATYIYSGNMKQVTGSGLPASVDSLVINNMNGVSLSAPQTVNRKLALGVGNLHVGSHNLTIQNAGTIAGASAAGYVATDDTAALSGVLKRTATSGGIAVLYPVGSSLFKGSYTPAIITMTSGTTDVISVSVFSGILKDGLSGPRITTHGVNRSWIISEDVTGGSNVTVQLQWNDTMELPSFIRSSTGISRHNGTVWNLPATAAYTPATGTNPYLASRSNITAFSVFIVGDSTINTALPVKLLRFTGAPANADVVLKWETAQEINNSHFEVERSVDGTQYMVTGSLKGAGTSTIPVAYQFTDEQVRGINKGVMYYRLKQIDYNGKVTIYGPIAIAVTGKVDALSVYPNPVINEIYLDINSEGDETISVIIYDMQGLVVTSKEMVIQAGSNHSRIDGLEMLAGGVYYLQTTVNGTVYNKKLIRTKN